MKWIYFVFIFLTWSSEVYALPDAKVEKLPIYLFELKPLIYQENGLTKGQWADSFQKLSKLAHLDFQYQFVSISRMELMLSRERPGCNLTLLRTPQRENGMKINFIYEHPEKTILRIYRRATDERMITLKEFGQNKNYKLVTNTSAATSALLIESGVHAELLPSMGSMIRMLLLKRIDAIVASNLAVEKMDEFKQGKIVKGPIVKILNHGIGCSKGTSSEVISRLRAAAPKWKLE